MQVRRGSEQGRSKVRNKLRVAGAESSKTRSGDKTGASKTQPRRIRPANHRSAGRLSPNGFKPLRAQESSQVAFRKLENRAEKGAGSDCRRVTCWRGRRVRRPRDFGCRVAEQLGRATPRS